MSQEKTVDIRLAAIQKYCADHHIFLGFEFDPVDSRWQAWEGDAEQTDSCDTFEDMLEALEAEFQL